MSSTSTHSWFKTTFKPICPHENTRTLLGKDSLEVVCVDCGTILMRRAR